MIEISDKVSASLRFSSMKVLLELRILGLKKHSYLLGLLLLEVGLLFGTVRGRVAVFATDRAFDDNCVFRLEGTGPGPVAFYLAVVTEVVVNALNLIIVAVQQIFEFLIFFAIEYLLNLFHSFFKLVIVVCHDDYM